ncbi:radical SAM protein, partial [archaeon]|nr:radical SAM protein [archaeon]
ESLPGTGLLLLETKTGIESITTNAAEHKRLRKQTLLGALPIMPRYLLQNEDEVSSGFDIFQNPKEENLKTAQVMVGQGCPYACAFCSEGIGTVWYDDDAPNAREPRRSIEHLEKELQELKQEGYEAIFFDDSTFFAKPKKYLAEVLDLLAKYEFRWGCQTTQKSIHAMKEFLPKMREAGMDYVYIGIEHYSGEIRDNFGKNVRGGVKVSGNVEHTLSMLEEAEVSVGISLTFGHPDTNSPTQSTTETLASARYAIDRTKELIQMYHNVVGVSCNLVTYHPGTPISEMFEREVGPVDYTGLPNQSAVYAQFEEGMGPHAAGLTDSLVNFIANYAAEKFGKKLWM